MAGLRVRDHTGEPVAAGSCTVSGSMDESRPELVRALEVFVAERDVPCPGCGYNLRGLEGSRCPECGLEVRLGVQLEEPAMGSLMVTLAALFSVVGSSGAIVLGVVWLSLFYGDWAPWQVWFVPVVALLAGGPAAFRLASRAGRVWFRKRGASARRAYAAGAWVAAMGTFLAFMVLVTGL